MQPLLAFVSDALTIRPWPDDATDRHGFDPRSAYVERFWLGVLGPSTTWLLRRLAAGFDDEPEGFVLPLGETARSIGLGDRGGRHSPFLRSVNRMIQFDMAALLGAEELAVRRRMPQLSPRHLARLSDAQRADHAAWMDQRRQEPADESQRRRGRQLALSLLELGEGPEEAERQLLRWRYHPALAREAADWAVERHRCADAAARAG